MSDTPVDANAPKRFRSPPYPSLPLAKAIERAAQLYKEALHHSVGAKVLATAWEYGEKSSGLWATAAALIQYGLLIDEGTGSSRKFQITDIGHRIIRDADPSSAKRKRAIHRAALNPKIHAELWNKYGRAHGLSDVVIKNHLTLDRRDGGNAPYSDSAADEVIQVYRETIAFAGFDDSGSVSPSSEETADENENDHNLGDKAGKQPTIGDFVQWTSNGQEQFSAPKRVTWISEDGDFARVLGSNSGLPMSELTIMDRPGTETPPALPGDSDQQADRNPIEIFLSGQRLQISASVNLQGIKKLKKMLGKYEEILSLEDDSDKAGG